MPEQQPRSEISRKLFGSEFMAPILLWVGQQAAHELFLIDEAAEATGIGYQNVANILQRIKRMPTRMPLLVQERRVNSFIPYYRTENELWVPITHTSELIMAELIN